MVLWTRTTKAAATAGQLLTHRSSAIAFTTVTTSCCYRSSCSSLGTKSFLPAATAIHLSSSVRGLHHYQQQTRSYVYSTKPLSMTSSASNDGMMISGVTIRQSLFGDMELQGRHVEHAMEALALADGVCFDVDSTVVDEEGIDVLAEFLGKGKEVAALTLQAMEGGMKFQDALKLRLDMLRPSKQNFEDCLKQHPLRLTQGVREFIQALQQSKKDVYLVSGGFRIMIEPIAEQLHIPKTNIIANTIIFDKDGNYQDFDPKEPTSRDMGKPKALQMILHQRGGTDLNTTLVMIGDGATDAQAKPPAKAFIGYGGVAVRSAVVEKADWFVTDFTSLTKVISQYGTR